jgi:hypothetical protein
MPVLGPEGGIARDLETEGFGVFDETGSTGTIFVGEEPTTPDNVIVVLNSVGGSFPSAVSEEWLIAVRVRNLDYEAAHVLLRQIAIYLQEKGQGGFGGIRIGRLAPDGTPVTLGRDENRRWRVEQVFSALMKRSFEFS